MLKEKYEAVKTHVKENKAAYISGGVCLVVGAAGALILKDSSTMVSFKEILNMKYKSPTTMIAQIIIPALGDPGNLVQVVETTPEYAKKGILAGTVFASQGAMAKALDVAPTKVSKYLNGAQPDINGVVAKIVGKAGQPLVP